jgi:hypothetical protein
VSDDRWKVDWAVELPERMSVTLGRKADACPRDAAMYLRYRGQASATPLLRGTLGHVVFERIMGALMVQGEESLFAAQPGEDPVKAAAEVSQTTKEWVDSLVEELGMPLSEFEIDEVRQMAYHFAVGNDVNPAHVVALEQSFVLDLEDGGQLIGKVDLAYLPDDGILRVRDYKTSFYVPPGEDVSKAIQVPWYAALILWGRPYERETCTTCEGEKVVRYEAEPTGVPAQEAPCPDCAARGYVERIGESLGLQEYVQWVFCEQVYPRFLNKATGMMSARTISAPGGGDLWGLADLRDKAAAASRVWRRVKQGVETGVWPAKSGDSHCSECTARAECPIPSALRRHAGEILTVAQASEAKEWAVRQASLVKATNDEVQAFVKAEGLEFLDVGADRYGFVVSHPTSLRKDGRRSDWEGLQEAVQGAVTFGKEFDVRDWLLSKPKTEFRKVKREEAA